MLEPVTRDSFLTEFVTPTAAAAASIAQLAEKMRSCPHPVPVIIRRGRRALTELMSFIRQVDCSLNEIASGEHAVKERNRRRMKGYRAAAKGGGA